MATVFAALLPLATFREKRARMKPSVLVLLAAGFSSLECTLDDSERCPHGYAWNDAYLSCECDVGSGFYLEVGEDSSTCRRCTEFDTRAECQPADDTDGAPGAGAGGAGGRGDAGHDAGGDAGRGGTEGEAGRSGGDGDSGSGGDAGLDSGVGAVCSSGEDCAEFDANYCAISPLSPTEPGYCTFENCSPGGCLAPYRCCDLSGLGLAIACLNEADAQMAQSFSATCN